MTNTTNTRRYMDHSNCTHASTTDARTTCRELAKSAGTWPMVAPVAVETVNLVVGNGTAVHRANDNMRPACGAGVTGKIMDRRLLDVDTTNMDVTCKNCRKLNGI